VGGACLARSLEREIRLEAGIHGEVTDNEILQAQSWENDSLNE